MISLAFMVFSGEESASHTLSSAGGGPQVSEMSSTHWDCTDAATFTSAAPYVDVASEWDEENT